MEDERRGLPYAPYLMFMIERVTRFYFSKDGVHTVYKIKKTQSCNYSGSGELSCSCRYP